MGWVLRSPLPWPSPFRLMCNIFRKASPPPTNNATPLVLRLRLVQPAPQGARNCFPALDPWTMSSGVTGLATVLICDAVWNKLEPSTPPPPVVLRQCPSRQSPEPQGHFRSPVHETTPPESKKLALPLPRTPWVPRSRMVQPPQRRPRKPGLSLLRLPVSGHIIEAIQPQQATEPFSSYGRGEGTHGVPRGKQPPRERRGPLGCQFGPTGPRRRCLLAGHLRNTHIRKAASRPGNL